MRVWIKSGAAAAVFLGAVCAALYLRYGGGEPYSDLSTPPALPETALEVAAVFPEPFGNVAASADGRLFFTVHPESRPEGPRLYEWKDGEAVAYPNEEISAEGFVTPLGLSVDQQGRLWVIDHGNHGLSGARLVAFDLASGQIVHDKQLDETGEAGSFLNDLTVSPDGRYVYIADVSFFRQNPALVVYEVAGGKAWRVLEDHASVTAQDWIIENPVKRMTFFGGLIALKPGMDGIVIDEAGEYVYYSAMAHDGLYRVPAALLNAPETSAEELARAVERVGGKPLSDGLSIDRQGNVYITDVEHGGIARLSPQGALETLIASDKVRWADGISYSGDGYFYFTDSAIPDQMLQTKAHIESRAPYYLYRFKADIAGIPGR